MLTVVDLLEWLFPNAYMSDHYVTQLKYKVYMSIISQFLKIYVSTHIHQTKHICALPIFTLVF